MEFVVHFLMFVITAWLVLRALVLLGGIIADLLLERHSRRAHPTPRPAADGAAQLVFVGRDGV